MIGKPVVPRVNVLLHPSFFIAPSCRRPLGKPLAQKLWNGPAMDKRVVNDQSRKGQHKTILVSPRHSRLKIPFIEKHVLCLSHLEVILTGIPQQLFKLTIINQRRYSDLFKVGAQLITVSHVRIDVHLDDFIEIAIFCGLRTPISDLPYTARSVGEYRNDTVISLDTTGFKDVDHLLADSLLLCRSL